MTKAIDVTGDPVLERHARLIFYKLSHHRRMSIHELKEFSLSRGLDPYANATDLANLLTVISIFIDEHILVPVLNTDQDRSTWAGYLSGDLDNESLLDRIEIQFRPSHLDRYGKNETLFLRVLDR